MVETKRGTDARLKTALAALQQIYDATKHDSASDELVLRVNEIAAEGFETATKNLPRAVWQSPQETASE